MAVAFDKNIGSGSMSMALSAAITVPAGGVASGCLVVVRTANKDNAVITSVTDTGGNTYAACRAAESPTGLTVHAFASKLSTALVSGNTITVNFNIKCSGNASADSWTGVDSATPTATNSGTGTSTSPSSGAAAVTTSGDLAVGAMGYTGATTEPTNDSDTTDGSWSQLTWAVAGGAPGIDGAYKITTGTSSQTYDETIASHLWACQIYVFAAAVETRRAPAIVAPSYAARRAANF